MINLSVANISRCYFLNKKKLKEIVRFILKSVGVFEGNLSIVFTTDKEIKRLNYLYRKENRPTDVLSFSMREGKPLFVKTTGGRRLRNELSILGDVIISVDRAKRQARRFNSTFQKEIYLYLVHGILHLLGYGDKKPLLRKKMRKKETEILNLLWEKID